MSLFKENWQKATTPSSLKGWITTGIHMGKKGWGWGHWKDTAWTSNTTPETDILASHNPCSSLLSTEHFQSFGKN